MRHFRTDPTARSAAPRAARGEQKLKDDKSPALDGDADGVTTKELMDDKAPKLDGDADGYTVKKLPDDKNVRALSLWGGG